MTSGHQAGQLAPLPAEARQVASQPAAPSSTIGNLSAIHNFNSCLLGDVVVVEVPLEAECSTNDANLGMSSGRLLCLLGLLVEGIYRFWGLGCRRLERITVLPTMEIFLSVLVTTAN